MPILYNYQSKKVEKVDDENVQALVSSGNYGFMKGRTIPVIAPDGSKGSIPSENAASAFNDGFIFETAQLTKQLAAQDIAKSKAEAFGGTTQEFAAGAAGVLRGATLGLSDVGLSAVGLGDELSDLKDINPGASLTGELTGGILGTMVATPIAAVSKGAGLAAKAISNPLGKAILAPTIEGAAQGIGSVLSQAALSDPDLNMTHAVSEIGLGGVLGAGFGAVGKGASMSWDKLKSAAVNLKMGEKVNKSLAQVTNLIKNVAPEDKPLVIEAFTNKSDMVYEALTNPDKVSKMAFDSFQKLDDVNAQLDNLSLNLRNEYRENLTESAASLINPIKSLSKEIQGAINTITEKSAYYDKSRLEVLGAIKNDLLEGLNNVTTKNEAHLLVEQTRKNLDKYGIRYGNALNPLKPGESDTNNIIKGVRESFKEHLVNKKHYGEYADVYSDVNKAYSFSQNISDDFDKLFKGDVTDLSGVNRQVLDTNKIDLYMRNPEAIRNFKKSAVLENAKKIPRVYENILNKYVKDPELSQTLLSDMNLLNKGITDLEDSRTLAILMNSLESKTGKSTIGAILGATAGPAIGGALGGFPGAAAGYLLGNPVTMFKYIKALEKNGLKGQSKLVDSVNSFIGKSRIPDGFKGTRNVTIKELIDAFSPEHEEKEYDTDTLKSVLESTQNDIEPILNKIDRYNPRFNEDFEDHYVSLANMSQQAAGFLNSKLPAKSQNALFPTKIKLSKSEEQKFNAYATAVMYPDTFLKEIASGRAKQETIETMQTVYPRFYEETRKEIFNGIVNNNNVPYQRKIQMAKIFNIPTTVALENLQILQDQYLMDPNQNKQPGVDSLSQGTQTPLQSIQA